MEWSKISFILIILIISLGIGSYFEIYNNNDNVSPSAIQKLTRQTARWLIAAQQDESPMIAALHAQYGMGYLWAIKDITSPSSFRKATGRDWEKFETEAVKVQDDMSRKIASACPQYVGDINKYLGRVAGDM